MKQFNQFVEKLTYFGKQFLSSCEEVFADKPTTRFLILVFVLLFSGAIHATNMFHYPYFEGDEGTYISQAWSVVKNGELAPYTYWYDHAPAGWYAIAAFVKIMGGDFFLFGSSNNMGRVFMLVIHLASAWLIFRIVSGLTKNPWIGAVSVVLFSISSLEVYFQRRMLLDNIMIFWSLSSVAILLSKRENIWNFILSGMFIALAVLTKITAVLFAPALLLAVIFGSHKIPRTFRVTLFAAAAAIMGSLYVLYATIKGEFVPTEGRVSLISSFLFQMSRGGGSVPFWNDQSMFMQVVYDWIFKDSVYVLLAASIICVSIVVSYFRRNMLFFLFGLAMYLLFLIRGGVVLNFYILPIFPLVAILGGLILDAASRLVPQKSFFAGSLMAYAAIVALLSAYGHGGKFEIFFADETSQQIKAVQWVKENLNEDQVIIADNYALVDLWDKAYFTRKSFVNADWFYKVENDPEIRDKKYGNTWKNFDYLLVNHEIIREIDRKESPLMEAALVNSYPVAKWLPKNKQSFVDEQKFISTNGDWVMVYAIRGETQVTLLDAWKRYKSEFIQSYGQVVDPDTKATTSEGQSYAMLQAAWMNDKEAFKGVWLWTKHHFQNRVDDKLFSWKWQGDSLSDATNASDADQDIALALLFGYRMFGEQEYLSAAKEIISDIWRQEVREINGRLYLLPMNHGSAMHPGGVLFNPSYLSPAWYKIFQEVDPEHDWNRLVDDSYKILNDIAASSQQMKLPLNWYIVNEKTGRLTPAYSVFKRYADQYSYDAFRTLWRVAMDEEWFKEARAKKYLAEVSKTITQIYQKQGKFPTAISSTGQALSWEASVAVSVGYLAALPFAQNSELAKTLFQDAYVQTYNAEKHTWGSGNYYDSNWAWFGVALYHHDLFNLWNVRLYQ